MQAEHLVSLVSGADNELRKILWEKIDEKVERYANGNLDPAVDAITLLWKMSKRDRRSSPVSPIITDSVSQHSLSTSPSTHRRGQPALDSANRRPVEIALIKSIREGTFFDRTYWARKSKSARVFRPLYISSIVTGEHLSYIDSCE